MEYVSTAKWRPACGLRVVAATARTRGGKERRWHVCRGLGEGWRLFSTFSMFAFLTKPGRIGKGFAQE